MIRALALFAAAGCGEDLVACDSDHIGCREDAEDLVTACCASSGGAQGCWYEVAGVVIECDGTDCDEAAQDLVSAVCQ